MIRAATMSDSARVIELLRASHIGAGFHDGSSGFAFPFVETYAHRLFHQHVEMMDACAIVHDVDGDAQGVLLATAYEHRFGPVWIASETVWWIDPAHRGRSAFAMLDAYESWARGKRCAYVGMAGMGDDPDVAALYERRGYRRAETHFLKAV